MALAWSSGGLVRSGLKSQLSNLRDGEIRSLGTCTGRMLLWGDGPWKGSDSMEWDWVRLSVAKQGEM